MPSNLDANKRVRTNFAWNTTYRKPSTITVTPLLDVNGGSEVQTTISYNTFGLPETQTISSGAEAPRTTSFTYDSANYFVTKIDNDYFTESEQAIHPESGLPQWQQDANGNRISTYYDDFHRVIRVVSPGQPDQFTGLQHCYGGCPLRAKFKQVFTQAGAPTQTQYMDKMGRVLKTQRPNYPAGTVTQWQSYDALGRVAFESVPSLNDTYLSTSSSNGTYYLAYDVLGRVLSKRTNVSESNELNVDYNYGAGPFTGFSTEITAGSNIMSRTHNGAGQLMQTNDAENGITRYAYDGAGNPIVIEDANQISITSKYNSLGQKTFVTDPLASL